ncbi:E3 ubiquitin-protein ligase SspH2 [Pandoraea horticolens]|uniref:E3 ubiquitin-protein ligase SspH2 n=1 Tax=Pandoraea horticolens TaxID=2508298 RepID=A0A5E4ULQ4_9BURK|nr:hypothetical protein [Pandoraea horticolens]VVE00961.1 E3 ubiquitin-protein ligase SspH2 [Pandoraea horticolens]
MLRSTVIPPMMPITHTGSPSLAQLLNATPCSPRQVNEAKRLVLEYMGQRDDPGHERRCTALLAALAWTHRQFGQTGGADIKSVCRDLTQHLARSCREGVDAEALVDALVSLCSENSRGSHSTEPSPAYVQLARDVLATLETQVDASKLLSELIGNMPERQEGQGSGVDELYRSALCAWVALMPPGWAMNYRARVKDLILNMADGKLDLRGLRLESLPELPAGLTALNVSGNGLTELPALPSGLKTLDVSVNKLTHLPELPTGLKSLDVSTNRLTVLPALPPRLEILDVTANHLVELPELPSRIRMLHVSDNQLRRLPALPAALTELAAYRNQLTELPPLPAGLAYLSVYENRLRWLPELPAGLTMLDVRNNQLVHLPPSALSMRHKGLVYVDGNPLSPDFLQGLRETTSALGYSGPRIYFSMAAPDK